MHAQSNNLSAASQKKANNKINDKARRADYELRNIWINNYSGAYGVSAKLGTPIDEGGSRIYRFSGGRSGTILVVVARRRRED